ncbi:unnamed protein product [Nezara viridula]|uniref:Uncharacterized protein n=1 Tax=Nezara viridula TaxID=85310 RepID=A0A9P0HQ62_NEZVI|nr:unnamed protein product [Nezara viridula]
MAKYDVPGEAKQKRLSTLLQTSCYSCRCLPRNKDQDVGRLPPPPSQRSHDVLVKTKKPTKALLLFPRRGRSASCGLQFLPRPTEAVTHGVAIGEAVGGSDVAPCACQMKGVAPVPPQAG